jgi:hypothetical protein
LEGECNNLEHFLTEHQRKVKRKFMSGCFHQQCEQVASEKNRKYQTTIGSLLKEQETRKVKQKGDKKGFIKRKQIL